MRSIMTKIIAGTVLLAASVVLAADDGAATVEAAKNAIRFKRADTNGDGRLALEEYSAHTDKKDRAAMYFNRKDLNKDGFLTVEEYSGIKPEMK